jgi:Fe-S cluster assembly ATPase SufC
MITRIYADNYRTLLDLTFEPPQIGLLYGPNGAGKSSVLEVVAAIQDIVVRGYAVGDVLAPSTFTRWTIGARAAPPIQEVGLDLDVEGVRFRYKLRVVRDLERDTCRILDEQIKRGGAVIYSSKKNWATLKKSNGKPAGYMAGGQRSLLADLAGTKGLEAVTTFLTHLRDVWVLRLAPWAATATTKREEDWLARDGANFASWLRGVQLTEPDLIGRLAPDFERLLDGYRSLAFVGSPNAKDLVVRFAAPGGTPYELAFDALSLGQRQAIMLYAVLRYAESKASALLIDEPDTFVTLREIQPWLQELDRAVSERGVQALVISHHPEVIDYLAANAAYLAHRPSGGRTDIRLLELTDAGLAGLKLSEIIARGEDTDE